MQVTLTLKWGLSSICLSSLLSPGDNFPSNRSDNWKGKKIDQSLKYIVCMLNEQLQSYHRNRLIKHKLYALQSAHSKRENIWRKSY